MVTIIPEEAILLATTALADSDHPEGPESEIAMTS